MDDKAVEAVKSAIWEWLAGTEPPGTPIPPRPSAETAEGQHLDGLSRTVIEVYEAEIAEATKKVLREIEAAARVAEHETLAAPNAPGWPAVCAVLHHLKELRAMLAAAPDQR